jgi:hypothetical protein
MTLLICIRLSGVGPCAIAAFPHVIASHAAAKSLMFMSSLPVRHEGAGQHSSRTSSWHPQTS